MPSVVAHMDVFEGCTVDAFLQAIATTKQMPPAAHSDEAARAAWLEACAGVGRLWERGASLGHAESQFRLAMCLLMRNGKCGIAHDLPRGLALLRALTQHRRALNSLAIAHREGYWFNNRDFDAAYACFEAMTKLPLIPTNLDPANTRLEEALALADLDISPHNDMQLELPRTTAGKKLTLQQQIAACNAILEAGCEAKEAACLHNLAIQLVDGTHGYAVDWTRGIELERRAAAINCANGRHAKWNLAMWHTRGRYGLEKSWATAEKLFLEAANSDALHSLGVAYDPDHPLDSDDVGPPVRENKRAFEYYTRAMKEFRNGRSAANLVDFYDGHKPFPEFIPDPAVVIQVTQIAERNGFPQIQFQLEGFLQRLRAAVQMQHLIDAEADATKKQTMASRLASVRCLQGSRAKFALATLLVEPDSFVVTDFKSALAWARKAQAEAATDHLLDEQEEEQLPEFIQYVESQLAAAQS